MTALEARVDAHLTLNFVQQQLLHNELKLKGQETTSESVQDSALVGVQKLRPPIRWTCE